MSCFVDLVHPAGRLLQSHVESLVRTQKIHTPWPLIEHLALVLLHLQPLVLVVFVGGVRDNIQSQVLVDHLQLFVVGKTLASCLDK